MRCPIRQLQLAPVESQREILRWKDQYPLFKKGRLLVPGEISSQPARWLEAMLFLEELEKRQESKYLKLKEKSEDDDA